MNYWTPKARAVILHFGGYAMAACASYELPLLNYALVMVGLTMVALAD